MMSGNQSVSVAEVVKHARKDDCWIVVNGKVYDLTNFAPSHPGGPESMMATPCSWHLHC